MSTDSSTCFGDCPKPKKSKTSEEQRSLRPYWADLPAVVIHEIFDYLHKKDRQNAASVCKNWRQNLFHPKWWPKVIFKIEPFNVSKAKFFTSVFGGITAVAIIKVNTLQTECTTEFISLIETLGENYNLKELIVEPSHCHFYVSKYQNRKKVVNALKKCLPNLTKFSIGCIEEFAQNTDEYLKTLTTYQPNKVKLLGLASVKDNPNEYQDSCFEGELIAPFVNLQILSVDYDQLSDKFLSCLDNLKKLERLVVHLHGVQNGHPGTTDSGWIHFKNEHPNCELRLTVIHSYIEVKNLHETILKNEMPLTHLKVFFCESINMRVLEFLSSCCADTIRSIVWVDSLNNNKESWSFLTSHYDNSPDPLIMISWLCKNLNSLVFYGYKYCAENLIAIARLRGDKLKVLEVAEDDILFSNNGYSATEDNFMIDIPLHLKQPWTPTKTPNLHPVIRDPTAGDSDEYLLPLVLADLH